MNFEYDDDLLCFLHSYKIEMFQVINYDYSPVTIGGMIKYFYSHDPWYSHVFFICVRYIIYSVGETMP